MVTDAAQSRQLYGPGGLGTFSWPGAYGTWWQADPSANRIMLYLIQNLNIRLETCARTGALASAVQERVRRDLAKRARKLFDTALDGEVEDEAAVVGVVGLHPERESGRALGRHRHLRLGLHAVELRKAAQLAPQVVRPAVIRTDKTRLTRRRRSIWCKCRSLVHPAQRERRATMDAEIWICRHLAPEPHHHQRLAAEPHRLRRIRQLIRPADRMPRSPQRTLQCRLACCVKLVGCWLAGHP